MSNKYVHLLSVFDSYADSDTLADCLIEHKNCLIILPADSDPLVFQFIGTDHEPITLNCNIFGEKQQLHIC